MSRLTRSAVELFVNLFIFISFVNLFDSSVLKRSLIFEILRNMINQGTFLLLVYLYEYHGKRLYNARAISRIRSIFSHDFIIHEYEIISMKLYFFVILRNFKRLKYS